MKPINFINSVSPTVHRSIARFIRTILIVSISLFTILGIITVHQLRHLKTLKSDIASLATHCTRFKQLREQQEHLQTTEQELRAKITTAITLRKKQLNPHDHLQALHTCMPPACTLHTISMQTTMITCSVQCKDPRTAHTYTQTLIKTRLFSTARITEIRNQNHSYQATIELTFT
jgi:Tfp pilus assembly protein PilN